MQVQANRRVCTCTCVFGFFGLRVVRLATACAHSRVSRRSAFAAARIRCGGAPASGGYWPRSTGAVGGRARACSWPLGVEGAGPRKALRTQGAGVRRCVRAQPCRPALALGASSANPAFRCSGAWHLLARARPPPPAVEARVCSRRFAGSAEGAAPAEQLAGRSPGKLSAAPANHSRSDACGGACAHGCVSRRSAFSAAQNRCVRTVVSVFAVTRRARRRRRRPGRARAAGSLLLRACSPSRARKLGIQRAGARRGGAHRRLSRRSALAAARTTVQRLAHPAKARRGSP